MLNSLLTKGLKLAMSVSSKKGRGGRLWILIFHRVLEQPDPLRPGEADGVSFDWQMGILDKYFNVLSLNDAFEALSKGVLPTRAVTITFDDGYADNLTLATPILEKYNFPATVFISAGFLDGGRMWNDTIIESVRNWPTSKIDLSHIGQGIVDCQTYETKRNVISIILTEIKHRSPKNRQAIVDMFAAQVEGLPQDLMLTTDGVKELHSRGIEIGAHTINHPILASLKDDDAYWEIAQGKQRLEAIVDSKIDFFAYPNGQYQSDYTDSHIKMLHDLGFKAAVSTNWGVATSDTNVMQLPRFTPWDGSNMRYIYRAIQNYRKVCGA
jgi:peptidoglycan/xylan/chitin deacetylase (PgdA/CDA1 family)